MDYRCASCSEYKITETVHERCMDHECACECRGPRLDLTNVRTRLAVAQILQTVADSSFLSEETPESLYVNGLIKDFAREKMQGLFGLVTGTNQLDSEEVNLVRHRLSNEYVLVSEFEEAFNRLQGLIENTVKTVLSNKTVNTPKPVVNVTNNVPAEPEQPKAAKVVQRLIRAPSSKPMPNRSAFLGVTQEQSMRTVEMNQRRPISDQSLNEIPNDTGDN